MRILLMFRIFRCLSLYKILEIKFASTGSATGSPWCLSLSKVQSKQGRFDRLSDRFSDWGNDKIKKILNQKNNVARKMLFPSRNFENLLSFLVAVLVKR